MAYSEQPEKKTQDPDRIKEAEPLTWMFWKKRRYIIVVMAFLGFLTSYILSNMLSVAIIEMTKMHIVNNSDGTISYEQEFFWESDLKGFILSICYFGFFVTPIFGGYLGSRFGGHRVFGSSLCAMAILTIIAPISVTYSLELFLVIRFVKGAILGLGAPALQGLWARWAPPFERSRMASMVASGFHIGPVVVMPAAGFLASSYGWRSCYYVFGIVGLIWYAGWLLIVKGSPEDDRYCCEDERRYIQLSLGMQVDRLTKHPWFAILTSVPVFALIVSQFTLNWGAITISTQYPTFLADAMDIEASRAGLYAAIPFLIFIVLLGPASYLSDWLPANGYLTRTLVRKIFCTGSFVIQFVAIMFARYVQVQKWRIVFITLSIGFGAFSLVGLGSSSLDLAPQHATIISGIQCTIGAIPGFVSPYLTGVIVKKDQENGWSTVLYISGLVYLLGAVVYGLFGSSELQEWAKAPCAKNGSAESAPKKEIYDKKAIEINA